jgi:hypothetical protein
VPFGRILADDSIGVHTATDTALLI